MGMISCVGWAEPTTRRPGAGSMDKPNLIDVVIAPLKWLERSRGWRRRALLFFYILFGLVGGVFAWRELSLWRLPNAPEPFDLKKYGRVDVAEADNAMTLYRVAGGRVKDASNARAYRPAGRRPWEETDWSKADPEVIRWVEDSRSALDPWLMAVEKPDALIVQPEDSTISTILAAAQAIRQIARMAALEGSRRMQAGDVEGAWQMYRGMLRSSRHAGMHSVAIQRLIGNATLKMTRPLISAWVGDPRVTSPMLHRAIAEVETCQAMTSLASEMIRCEYFADRDALRQPEMWGRFGIDSDAESTSWENHLTPVREARRFLRREPERSLRVLRLIVAGHLAQSDRPRALRPKLLFPEFMIYDHDVRTPPAVRAITPEALNAWAKNSAMKGLGYYPGMMQSYVDFERGQFDALRLPMAERAYRLDHGHPPRTYAELVGPYIKDLPDGIEPTDPIGGAAPVVEK